MKPTIKAKFEVCITPLNENQPLNYNEHVCYSLDELRSRCENIISGLSAILPAGTFHMQIVQDEKIWYFRDHKFYDEECNEITTNLLLLTI